MSRRSRGANEGVPWYLLEEANARRTSVPAFIIKSYSRALNDSTSPLGIKRVALGTIPIEPGGELAEGPGRHACRS